MPEQSILPYAQQRLFDKLGREFDAREYTKALRSANSILSIVPEHADTIAMKGLVLYHLERKDEGYECIRSAIQLRPTSTIAWHALGMCQRSDKNFTEALKAFKRALVTDASNSNVLRDISSMCIQLRDWEQFLETREKLVTLKASIRANWIAVSCAHRMLGHNALAAAMIDVMISIMDFGETKTEKSEIYLYQMELALDNHEPQRVMEILHDHDAEIVDIPAKLLIRAKAHTLLGQKIEAERRYKELIEMGISESDCVAAIAQLRKIALNEHLQPKHDTDKYITLLNELGIIYPKCEYVKRHRLDCIPIEEFCETFQSYAVNFVKKTIPSLFTVFKSLYSDMARVKVMEQVFLKWEQELLCDNFNSFGGERNPCYLLWVWTALASHYRRAGEHNMAHLYIDRAIEHTPTFEMLYVEKAKIYAREGNTKEAAEQADFARTLDLQDKYLNSKAAKYYFRDNNIDKGEEIMQLFYAASIVPGDTYLTALESQCLWYEYEVGEAFLRRGDCIAALQNFLMFDFHHQQNHDELSEFHNYVFRRNTMRAWFDVIACDDDKTRNPFYHKFASGIIRTYEKIHQDGDEHVRKSHEPRPELSVDGLSAENAKRITQLRKDFYLTNIDITEPLMKAEPYLLSLLQHRPNDITTHLLAIKYYTALRKPFLVASSLYKLKRLKYDDRLNLLSNEFECGLLKEMEPSLDKRISNLITECLDNVKKVEENNM